MSIIALCGERKSGKTVLANLIKKKFKEDKGYDVPIISFASPLKEEFCHKRGISLDYLEKNKEQYRYELEQFSIKKKEETKNQYIFTEKALGALDSVGSGYAIVDDLRLLKIEFKPLLERGAFIYRVYSDLEVRISRGLVPNPEVDNSPFETELALDRETLRKLGGKGWVVNNTNNISDLGVEASILISLHFFS